MTRYMLSTYSCAGQVRAPLSEEEIRRMHTRMGAVEEEMKATGTWVFSARLHEPETATVVRESGGELLTTDGPFAESKDHLGGFYVIEADDLDAALKWAAKVTACIKAPIEVRPFAGWAA